MLIIFLFEANYEMYFNVLNIITHNHVKSPKVISAITFDLPELMTILCLKQNLFIYLEYVLLSIGKVTPEWLRSEPSVLPQLWINLEFLRPEFSPGSG